MKEPEEQIDPDARSPLELSPDEMRRLGYLVVDRIVDRWEGLGDGPAWDFGTRRGA